MGTLHTFGCSHTESYETTTISPLYQSYYDWRGGSFPKVWSTLLSEKLGVDIANHGWASSTNQEIMNSVNREAHTFKKGDIVIIQWSYAHRFTWIDQNNNNWQRMGVNNPIKGVIHEQTFMDMIDFVTHQLYCDLIYKFEPMIEHLSKVVGFDVYYWSTEGKIIHSLPDEIKNQRKYLIPSNFDKNTIHNNVFKQIVDNGGDFIFNETNFEVNDMHLGETGHKVQADMFYNHIINK
jgi:hypothetical protein